jgi:hypothetical protein
LSTILLNISASSGLHVRALSMNISGLKNSVDAAAVGRYDT